MPHPLTPPEHKAAALPDLHITSSDPFATWIEGRLAPRRCDPALVERIACWIEALTAEQPSAEDVTLTATCPGPAHPLVARDETNVTGPQPLTCNHR